MATISNLRISAKILIGVALSTMLTIMIAWLGVVSLRSTSNVARDISERNAEALLLAGNINTAQNRVQQTWLFSAIEHDPNDFKGFVRQVEQTTAQIDHDTDALEALVPASTKADVAALRKAQRDYRQQTAKIPPLWFQGRLDDAQDVLQHDAKEPFAAADAAARTISAAVRQNASANSRMLAQDARSTIRTMITVSVIGLIAILALVLSMVRYQITRPLEAITERMRRLAQGDTNIDVDHQDRQDEIGEMAKAVLVFRDNARQQAADAAAKAQSEAEQQLVVDALSDSLNGLSTGDLTVDIVATFPPAYAQVRTNFNQAVSNLRELIGAVTLSTASIDTGAREIAAASENLARRTEGNAASLEETSAAVTQMNGRLHATAVAAKQTVERADGASHTVAQGREVADRAVQAMSRVSECAEGIDGVIESLDKIAFQTRVLAMNAAVEAGRAGEAGRGFAVVADLVSALAMRAEEEAKRVRDQLTVTREEIESAVDMVQNVDGAFAKILSDVGEVHGLLQDIAEANEAQSSAITQVSTAIGAMDQATQQNAAMVEETSAAARTLSSEVSGLAERASGFRIGSADEPSVADIGKPMRRAAATRGAASAVAYQMA
ncbi:MAG: methyl-accepting chemotaxis protein [Sphingomonas sp.]